MSSSRRRRPPTPPPPPPLLSGKNESDPPPKPPFPPPLSPVLGDQVDDDDSGGCCVNSPSFPVSTHCAHPHCLHAPRSGLTVPIPHSLHHFTFRPLKNPDCPVTLAAFFRMARKLADPGASPSGEVLPPGDADPRSLRWRSTDASTEGGRGMRKVAPGSANEGSTTSNAAGTPSKSCKDSRTYASATVPGGATTSISCTRFDDAAEEPPVRRFFSASSEAFVSLHARMGGLWSSFCGGGGGGADASNWCPQTSHSSATNEL
mmetsp:Transcript_68316/g.128101  ORF Transcript_68316/g.128101 Transcript_68316/m.128101 type:complete len:261 (-) Transcript_68316:1642-2424(-)